MRALSRVLWASALLAVVAGCDDARRGECRFGHEQAVFEGEALDFDDVALVAMGAEMIALVSEPSGVYLRRLDFAGRPRRPRERIAERCLGGIDAVARGGQLLIACLRPSEVRAAGAGQAVSLYRWSAASGATVVSRFGTAGLRSRGIVVESGARQLLVGFHDAIVGEARTWLAALPLSAADAAQPVLRVLSDAGYRGGPPSVVSRGEHDFAVWAETHDDGTGRVMWMELARASSARAVFTTRHASPRPALVAQAAGEGDGELVVAFRDAREARRKTGLYLSALDTDGRVTHQPLRVARADGVARPALRACARGSQLLAATPRTFGGDHFVGAVRVDPTLDRVSGEQQFYEDGREFAQVALACGRDDALLAIAERGKSGARRAALRAVPFACR